MNTNIPLFKNDKVKNELRERFNSHLPKYGTLWRSMLAMNTKSEKKPKPLSEKNIYTSKNESPRKKSKFPNFLDAIETGKPMTINGHKNNEGCDVKGCLGNCAEPIIEFDISNDEKSPQHKNTNEFSSNKPQKSNIDTNDSSSGEDLSSIAFDLSRIDLVSDDEDENSQENLNMTLFDDDLINNSIDSVENRSNMITPSIQDHIINAGKSNVDKNVQESLSSKSINSDKSANINSNSSGEDLASIAFDISQVYIQHNEDGECDQNINLTLDNENLKECNNNYCDDDDNNDKSLPHLNHQSKKENFNASIKDSKTDFKKNQERQKKIDSSICSTLSCKEFVALVKNLGENDDTNNSIKKAINEKRSIDKHPHTEVNIKNTHNEQSLESTTEKEKTDVTKCHQLDEDSFIDMITSTDQLKVPNSKPSQNKCEGTNVDRAEYYQNDGDLDQEKRKSINVNEKRKNAVITNTINSSTVTEKNESPNANIIARGIEDLTSCETEDNVLDQNNFDDRSFFIVNEETIISDNESDNEIEIINEEENITSASNHFDSDVDDVISLDNEESESNDNLKSVESESTSEEEWDDDYGEKNDECSSSVSNPSIGRREKIRSPTVLIVSDDDDISYYDNDDDDEWNDSEASKDLSSDEVESNPDDDVIDDDCDIDDENFFDSGSKNNEKSAIQYRSDDLIVAVSSNDESVTSQRRCRTKTKKKKKNSSQRINSPKQREVSKSSTLGMTRAVFIRKRAVLSSQLFQEFNKRAFNNALTSVPLTWSKRLQTTAGVTRLKRRGENKSAAIELSTKVIDNVERLRGTLLHEMCHAAQWLVDGVAKPSHGACFKKWANIAMKKIRDVKVTTKHDYVISYKFAWACTTPNCYFLIQRQSRSVDPKKHCCGRCKGSLIEVEAPNKNNNSSLSNLYHTPKQKRNPTGFSLFVQQHSTKIRQRLNVENGGKILQKDVMKECARLWKEKKFKSSNTSAALDQEKEETHIVKALNGLMAVDLTSY